VSHQAVIHLATLARTGAGWTTAPEEDDNDYEADHPLHHAELRRGWRDKPFRDYGAHGKHAHEPGEPYSRRHAALSQAQRPCPARAASGPS
jgi:hypothetical protein